ncbi:hypothetical protein [Methanopyrus sp.]
MARNPRRKGRDGWKQSKSRGKPSFVTCECCGGKVPRHKAIPWTQGFRITDPVVRQAVDDRYVHTFNRKVYYCPKCARFLGIRKPKRR